MNWQAIGAIGEAIGALAVVVSLIYLAIQIRHNTGQLEQQNRHHELTALVAIESCFSQFRSMLSQSIQVSTVWHQALEDLEQLSPEERTQIDYLFREFFWSWANFWIKVTRGDFREHDVLFDETSFEIVNHVKRRGMQQWWCQGKNRDLYFPEFAKLIDRIIEENPSET